MLTNELMALPSPINCQCRIDELLRLLRVKKNKLLIKFASGPRGYLGMYFAFRCVLPRLQTWHPLRRLYRLVFVRDFGMLRPYFGIWELHLCTICDPYILYRSDVQRLSFKTVLCAVRVLYEFQHSTLECLKIFN